MNNLILKHITQVEVVDKSTPDSIHTIDQHVDMFAADMKALKLGIAVAPAYDPVVIAEFEVATAEQINAWRNEFAENNQMYFMGANPEYKWSFAMFKAVEKWYETHDHWDMELISTLADEYAKLNIKEQEAQKENEV